MAFCGQCGAQLREDLPFCTNCGAVNPDYDQFPARQETSLVNVETPRYEYQSETPEPTQGTNGLAIAGMVLAFVFAPVGIILSAIALKRAKSGDYRNPLEGLAKAGLIVSIISTIVYAILLVVYIALLVRYLNGGYGRSYFNYY